MADPNFFLKSKSFTLSEIAERIPCTIHSSSSPESIVLDDVGPLNTAKSSHLSFLDNRKYKDDFKNTKAGACFVTKDMVEFAPKGTICLVTPYPYKSYALVAQMFYPEHPPEPDIAEAAIIHPSAKIGNNVCIREYAVIHAGAQIGDNTVIDSHTVIGENVQIGQSCTIESNVTVSHAIIGNNVRLYPGVRVGQDGFGFAIDPTGHVKVPQLGRVIIEDYVQIGANTTIDRGAGPDTIIGQGTWIDNLVQIGHNVQIGRGCIIVAQVGISGSTHIGDFVAIGGQVGIAGHLKIQSGARIAAQSGVMNDLAGGEEYIGSPAQPKSQFFRQLATLRRLIKPQKKS